MNKKTIKYIVIGVVSLLIIVLTVLIYKNLFAQSNGTRYEGKENYKLTNNEINFVEDKVNELEDVKSVDVYVDSRIIKIVVKLESDIDFEKVKEKANESLSGFSKENLTYYDVEFFVQSSNKESETYPQIGYKFKTNTEFSW